MMVPIVVVRVMIVAVIVIMLVVNSAAMIVFSYYAAGSRQQRYKTQQTQNYSHTKNMPPSEFMAMGRSPERYSGSLGVVILAAGRSSRMGRPKLLLPWDNTSVLGHLLQQWRALGATQISVVFAPNDHAITTELDRLGFSKEQRIVNPNAERGMFSSIQCAAAWPGWQTSLTHWAIVLGDQPHLRFSTLRTILDFSAAHADKVCQPRKDGHRHHPVLLPRKAFGRLAATDTPTLKDFLKTCEAAYCEIADPGLELDIDRPEDYEKARELAKLDEFG